MLTTSHARFGSRWRCAALLLVLSPSLVPVAAAQAPATQKPEDATDALTKRLDELERTTREQIDALRKELEQRKSELEQERARRAELERRVADLSAARPAEPGVAPATGPSTPPVVQPKETGAPEQAGARERNEAPDPLPALPKVGKDLAGNVFSSDRFKVRLGGSLRTSFQWNSTPVGDSVPKALLPDPTLPGGGDNAGRDSFRALAGYSRMLIAIQGPTTLGGRTFSYLEFDFARNLSGGESGAVNPNPRLRHAYLRWSFDEIGKPGSFLNVTVGQTGGYMDLIPDVVDFASMSGGLGVAYRRNPRLAVAYGLPVGDAGRLVFSGGIERPILGRDTVGGDLGNGDVSRLPVLSVGGGFESTRRIRLGEELGIGGLRVAARIAGGRFEERFLAGTIEPNFGLQTGFDERRYSARLLNAGLHIDNLGFNAEGRARTLSLKLAWIWTTGDAGFVDAGFDRRLVLRPDGTLETARSSGGFANPVFYLADNLSVRWAGGAQYALDPDLVVVTGSLDKGYFRTRNWQSEASVWWTPGPFTFALAYNYTRTNFRKIDPLTLVGVDLVNDNSKIEAIAWFSF